LERAADQRCPAGRSPGGYCSVAGAARVHFKPDAAARYERVDQVLAIAARSGASTFGFSGNEEYRDIL
jgi:hypothetical protein